MKIVADLHLHSRYSRAVSQNMVPQQMAVWAQKKGINLLGTGDWTHPLWFNQLKNNLVETQAGIYQLQNDLSPKPVSFVLSTEISSIYKQDGKTRRIHNLIIAPNLETADKINTALRKRGANLLSDGRPIIGLSARELAELVFETDENCLIIPCHIWTPWFSLFGSQSGFDSIFDCFGEFTPFIYGIETGLSSNPAANWRIKELDSRSILSSSDAHSPSKLGREATVLTSRQENSSQFTFADLAAAIKNDPASRFKIAYTIEFYPEEGKYHWTGHRQCQVKQSPEETKKLGPICPVCGKPLTLGVMHRVEELARQPENFITTEKDGVIVYSDPQKKRPPYLMIVPLEEIIAEALGVGPASKRVQALYEKLIQKFDHEFTVLLKTPLADLQAFAGKEVSAGINKMRQGDITIDPGFDGEFGKVKIWPDNQKPQTKKEQISLF